jgi:hypothetical protein
MELTLENWKEQLLLLLVETFPDVEISKTGNAKKIIDFMELQRQATMAEMKREFAKELKGITTITTVDEDDKEVEWGTWTQEFTKLYKKYSPSPESNKGEA